MWVATQTAEEVGAVDQAEVAEPGVLLGEDRGEAGGEEQGDRDQRDQLPVPGGPHGTPWLCWISSSSEVASARERRSWPVTASRRFGGSEAVWIGLA